MKSLEQFRAEARAWIEENCPPSMRGAEVDEEGVWGGRKEVIKNPDAKLWLDRMVAKGWTAPTWPKEYGGGGLSKQEARVLSQELRAADCRIALKSFGLWMLGPVLLEYANEEQKAEHIPKIVRGEIRWCQGYSEPGAGSDLAGLSCKAELDGDHYVVNGSKIWTSFADKADYMFCLVRTDFEAAKRDGISFLLIDMDSPGVSVKPIRLISGSSPFCETFFDNVRVPAKNLVGTPGGGWKIAKELLQHERAMISMARDDKREELETLQQLALKYHGADDNGEIADKVLRDRIAQVNMDFVSYKLTLSRSAQAAKAGRPPGPETSMFKYYGTELNKRSKDLRVLVAGYQGLGWEGDGYDERELAFTREWLRSRANSIEGGTSEVQLNIMAKRVLGLPD